MLPVLLLAAATPLQAQFGPSLRGAGMAGAYAGVARDYEAASWNPALLGLKTRPGWSFGLPAVEVSATMLGPDVFDWRDVMDKGDDMTDADRHNLLADIPASGLELRANLRATGIGLSIGPLALGFTSTGMVSGNLGKELVDLMLYTRQYGDIDKTRLAEYRVGNTSARETVYSNIHAAYGQMVDVPILPFPISVGVGGRYIIGHELQRGRIFEPTVDLDAQDIEITALAARSKGGTGYAIDFGLAAQPIPGLTLSFAIDNISHRMEWDEDVEIRGQTFTGSELSDMGVGDLMDRFEAREFDETGAPLGAYELVRDLFNEAYAPKVYRAGVGIQSRRLGTTIGATYSTVSGKGDMHVGWPKYASLGVEQKLPILRFISVRAGYATSLDGASARTAGLGLGLGSLNLTAAVIASEGHGDGPVGPGFDDYRYANRLAAGTGYGLFIGLDLLTF